jgi:hypothetical protein
MPHALCKGILTGHGSTHVHSSTVHKRWKQLTFLWWWINKMWYPHTMEYDTAFKKKEILTHVTMGIDPENISSEIIQS